jgi:hypothetical protein
LRQPVLCNEIEGSRSRASNRAANEWPIDHSRLQSPIAKCTIDHLSTLSVVRCQSLFECDKRSQALRVRFLYSVTRFAAAVAPPARAAGGGARSRLGIARAASGRRTGLRHLPSRGSPTFVITSCAGRELAARRSKTGVSRRQDGLGRRAGRHRDGNSRTKIDHGARKVRFPGYSARSSSGRLSSSGRWSGGITCTIGT